MSTFWNNFAVEGDQLEIQKLVLGEGKTVEPTILDVDDIVDEKVLASKNKEEEVIQGDDDSIDEGQVEDTGTEEESEDDVDSSGDSTEEDSEEDDEPAIDDGKEDEEDDSDEEDNEGKVATESYRHYYPHLPRSLSLEAYDNIYGGSTGVGAPYYYKLKNISGKAGKQGLKMAANVSMKGLQLVADSLKNIGVSDIKRVASSFYKGVLYVFSKISDGLMTSIYFLDKTIASHKESLSSIEKKIDKTIKNLDKLIEADIVKLKEDAKYTNVNNINTLKLSNDDLNFNASNTALLDFINKGMKSITYKIKEDIDTVSHVVNLNSVHNARSSSSKEDGTSPASLALLDVKLNNLEIFKEGTINGFESDSDKLSSYYTVTALPANVKMIAHLPRNGLDSMSDYAEAYNKSTMFIAIDTENFRTTEEVDYMDSKELGKYLLGLKALSEILKTHSNFYEDLRDLKVKNRSLYKNYFQSLGYKNKKVRLRNSMVEIVYLRNMLTDKVYIPAVVDLHHFVLKYLDAGVSFAKMNLLAFEENNV